MKPQGSVKMLTPAEAADFLSVGEYKVNERTMANWRTQGKGPKPTKIGRNVFYTVESLESYIRKRTGFDVSDAA